MRYNRVRVDPYNDWQQVYRTEVIDRARHWPVCNKRDSDNEGSLIPESNND